MFSDDLGNINICKTCIYKRFDYLNWRTYCERSDAASVTLKPNRSLECNLYWPTPCASRLQCDKYFIKKVIFNDPLTIVLWNNGDKTIVKCQERDIYDPEKGLAMAIVKYALGNEGNYYNILAKYLPKEDKTNEKNNN